MERCCGQYSVTNCRCDVGLSVVSAFDHRRSMCRPSKIEDRCVETSQFIIIIIIIIIMAVTQRAYAQNTIKQKIQDKV